MTSTAHHILLVEDDPALRKGIRQGLEEQSFSVRIAADIQTAKSVMEEPVNLLLLDLGLPDGSGFDFLKLFRVAHPSVPVLIMTARGDLNDKVKGLDLGADDYLVKPFDFQELSARIRALLRRSTNNPGSSISVSDLFIDLVKRSVTRDGAPVELTPREFDVLVYLANHAGRPVSRQLLMTEVWKVRSRMTSMDNVIDVIMSRLREKVDGDRDAKLIHTVRGLGFMIREPA